MSVSTYFDLRDSATSNETSNGLASSLPQYVAVALGVLVQPFYDAMRASAGKPSATLTWQVAIFSLIVAAMIFPAIYRAAWNTQQPRFVQYCSIFAAGVGWQSLIKMAAGAATKPVAAEPLALLGPLQMALGLLINA